MIEAYVRSVRNRYPDLTIRTAEPIESGQNNYVLLVNGDLIFRFPKYGEGIRALRLETAVLKALRGRLPLRVPYPEYEALQSERVGDVFAGYKRIEGEPLTRERFEAIRDPGKLRVMAEQLAGFMRALHGAELGTGEVPGLPAYRGAAEWRELYERIETKLFPYMSEAGKREARRHFEPFVADGSPLDVEPAWIHGDFGTSNLLYDPERASITGVIDFGFAGPGDPATDYAALLASYGDDFLSMVMEFNPDSRAYYERALFYKGTFALQEALFGLEHDDADAFRAGMELYR
ncbi:phosphotransferase family protein [Paenibacillus sp. GYB003]|uniref:phosphotransferase family protein n=1 Tax=Paenibacillus sp. GYB003 TaxID=2994392 RepID=UPI002F96A572